MCQSAPTLTAFIAFVLAQPAERTITHGYWRDCAVGDFCREVTSIRVLDQSDLGFILPYDKAAMAMAVEEEPYVDTFNAMECSSALMHHLNYSLGGPRETYGELANTIRSMAHLQSLLPPGS